ncbi:MAG: 1-acyl-sn-glycerol-3-phosphate acyltransferase [Lachnospiraceae bacterium]|nr:1-acyl-sn-glycerol-3-phosphate acyltransferase [Lachnospiraceae bacterium]
MKQKKSVGEHIKAFFAKIAFGIAHGVLRIIYPVKVTWEDKVDAKATLKKGCVVFSNHTGHTDGLYMAELLRHYKVYTYVAREWYDKKNINWLFRNLRYIPIDRKEMDTSWLTLGTKKLQEGFPVYMFPEGKTSKEEMNEFKPGFLVLAKQAAVPALPICIDGLFKPFHRIHIIVGKTMEMDLNEEGRPSQVMKKYACVCRDKVALLKNVYGREAVKARKAEEKAGK